MIVVVPMISALKCNMVLFEFLLVQGYRKIFGVSRDFGFGLCTGENWSPEQEYDSNRLAGMSLYCIALGQGFLPGGGIAPLCPPVATSLHLKYAIFSVFSTYYE